MASSNCPQLHAVVASAGISSLAAGFISHPIGFMGGGLFGAVHQVCHLAFKYVNAKLPESKSSNSLMNGLWKTTKSAAEFFATTASTWQILLACGLGMPFVEVIMLTALSMLAKSAVMSIARAFQDKDVQTFVNQSCY